ncbi:Ig-like domain repeat protein [Nocardioides sp. Iso805N]|uniref:Ig-like domain repeat protein n=1 Tax=Nocardioides sp. Iso805N TaxID=1283287 RepID=UPI0003777EF0|nr:Ig-like domain repeat protein [Nocardioides sp. Iso805N]
MIRPLAAIGTVAVVALALSGLEVAGSGAASANTTGTGLVINEVYQTDAVNGVYDASFVELDNPTSSPIDLAGKSLQTRGPFDMVLSTVPLSGTVPAGRTWLVQFGATVPAGLALPQPDQVAASARVTSNGEVILGTAATYGTGNLAGAAGVIDALGIGEATGDSHVWSFEGTPAAFADDTAAESQSRDAAGDDTDNNASDFTAGGPTPVNSTQLQPTRLTPTVTGQDTSTVAGQHVVTVPITVSGAGATPGGFVEIHAGDAYLGGAMIGAGGVANVSLSRLASDSQSLQAGTFTLTARYVGDLTYGSATDTVTVSVTAGGAPTMLTVPDALYPPVTETSVLEESVSVAAADSGPVPTGFVWIDYGTSYSDGDLDDTGSASVSLYHEYNDTFLSPGVNTLTLHYSGDATYAPSSTTFTVTVPVASSTTITAPATKQGTAGQVTVKIKASGATATGDVTLTGAGAAQTKPLGAGNTVTFSLPATLAAGSYALTASYAGGSGVQASTGKATFTVSPAAVVKSPAGGGAPHVTAPTAAQKKLAKDQAKLAKDKKALKKAHGAKKAKLKKKIAKLKKTIKADKKKVAAGK